MKCPMIYSISLPQHITTDLRRRVIMDIRELIDELNKWNAPNAEITINSVNIKRVENIGANTFSIVPEADFSIDDRIEELESELNDKKSDINSLEDEVSDYEYFVNDLKDDLNEAINRIEEMSELLDPYGTTKETAEIKEMIERFNRHIDKEIY